MHFIHGLRERPRTEGDYSDKDASFRIRQIKIIGDYAITYWLDDSASAEPAARQAGQNRDGGRYSAGRSIVLSFHHLRFRLRPPPSSLNVGRWTLDVER